MPCLGNTLALAAVMAAAATPAAASAPKGNGLIEHTGDYCIVDGQTIDNPQMLLAGGGSTFWLEGTHYAVKSVTWSGGYDATRDFGAKAGLPGAAIECFGSVTDPDLGVIYIHSVDVPIR